MEEYFQIRNGILEAYTGREESIVVPEGVHTIGEGACKGCVSLKRVALPSGLRCIGDGAFKGCRRLEEVEIPSEVSYIGSYAFHRCHALKRIALPASVKELGAYAFLYCDNLKEARIPGVRRLGVQAFANDMLLERLEISRELDEDCICDVFTGCSRVTEIAFADGERWKIPNVVEVIAGQMSAPSLVRRIAGDILRMMELEGRSLIRFLVNIKHVEVPEGIEVLSKSCFFDMRGVLSVSLPRSLKRIESRAFRNCISLERVSFGSERAEIDEDAFKNCTSLKTIRTCGGEEYTFAGIADVTGAAGEVPEIVRVIHRQVLGNFRLSGGLLLKYLGGESRVVIPEGITVIAEEAFAGNETIDRVILPESVEEIGAEAFRGCLLLQTVVFPKRLKRIGAGAFEGCVKLLRVSLPDGISRLEERVFRHCKSLLEITFPEGFLRIGESAFYGCLALKKLQLPESLVFIGKLAFYQCSGLKEVTLPVKTEYVESLAFAKSGVKRAWVSGSGRQFGADVFGSCEKLKILVFNEGVKHIPDKIAYGCTALEKVLLPRSLESAGRHSWEGTVFLKQWLAKQALSPEETGEIFWDGRSLSGRVRLSEEVKIVAGGAFYGNTEITEIFLPESVRFVGAGAYKGCRKLQKAFFPSGITSLEAEVFSGCTALEEVVAEELAEDLSGKEALPAWKSVGERAFYRCQKLRKICLEHIEAVGREAFAGCSDLIRSAVSDSARIGERAFEGTDCPKLLENGVAVVGAVVVSGDGCGGEICLPEGITAIAPYAFAGNRRITGAALPESLCEIGEGAFFGCSGLLDVKFCEGLSRIGARAFEKCISLRRLELPALQAGESAFAGCVSLERAALPKVSILGKRLFAGCERLSECVCENAKAVQPYCFSGCKSLERFSFQKVVVIKEYGFAGCESLKTVEFQDESCLGAHAFEDCCGIETILLSGERGEIHLREYAFSGCTALRKVVYQGKEWELSRYGDRLMEHIPEAARLLFHSAWSCFEVEREEKLCGYRGAARRIAIPEGIRQIGAEVFRDMPMLQEVEIPESVEWIGARAFHGTAWIEKKKKESPMVIVNGMLLDASGCVGEVTVPAEIRMVCGWAFANGMGIERIRFMSERVRVEEYAFRNCIFLREMILPDGGRVEFTGISDREKELPPLAKQAATDSMNCFKTDSEGVLRECTGNLSVLRLAYGITAIGEGAFQDGNLLTKVLFAESVWRVEKRAFSGCKWLCEVKNAVGVEEIEELAFFNCGSLKRIELSDKLRKIGARAFENCTSLLEIRIPEGVEEIPERAFYRCHSLRYVRLPSSIKRIGREAFAFCRGLSEMRLTEGTVVEAGQSFDCAKFYS